MTVGVSEAESLEPAPTEVDPSNGGEAGEPTDADEASINGAAVDPRTPGGTRPATASRHARRAARGRNVTRYTLDLETETHKFLRMFAVSNEVEASKVMRALLYLLEAGTQLPAGSTLADLVLDEIFAETGA